MGKLSSKKLPKMIALDSVKQSAFTKAVKKVGKSMKAKKLEAEERQQHGIILVSHLPYGFFEPALKGFFSQFGRIKRLRLARSSKTGRSKGYAFIEFEYFEVAEIAAESMNNYLMYERIIKCKVLEESNLDTKKIFAARYIKKHSFPTLHRRRQLIKDLAKPMDTEEVEKEKESRIKSIARNNRKLAALGINYKYEEVVEPKLETKSEPEIEPSPKFASAKVKNKDKRISPQKQNELKSPKVFLTPPGKKIEENQVKQSGSSEKKRKSSESLGTSLSSRIEKNQPPLNITPVEKKPKSPKSNKSTPRTELHKSSTPLSGKKRNSATSPRKDIEENQLDMNITPSEKKPKSPKLKKSTPRIQLDQSNTPLSAKKSQFSPKLLRSAARKSAAVQSQATTEISTSSVDKKKSKVSPKVLRSTARKNAIQAEPSPSQKTTKFSPKLLRSRARKSEVVIQTEAIPVKKTVARRKSMK